MEERPSPKVANLPDPILLPDVGDRYGVVLPIGNQLWFSAGNRLFQAGIDGSGHRELSLETPVAGTITALARTGRLTWVGTNGAGLYACNLDDGTLRRYSAVTDGLPFDEIRTMLPVGDTLWIGFGDQSGDKFHGGLGAVDLVSGNFRSLYPKLPPGINVSPYYFSRELDRLDGAPRQRVVALAMGSDDKLYLGVYKKGLQQFDPETGVWRTAAGYRGFHGERATAYPDQKHDEIHALAATGPYVATGCASSWVGMSIYNVRANSHTQLTEKAHGFPSGKVYAIAAAEDRFWVASEHGLLVVKPETMRCERRYRVLGAKSRYGVQADSAGNVYLCSYGRIYRIPAHTE
jgi:ligand-binding sensor domain-containing protein